MDRYEFRKDFDKGSKPVYNNKTIFYILRIKEMRKNLTMGNSQILLENARPLNPIRTWRNNMS